MAVHYITVTPVAKLFKPATRAFGDIAIVGESTGTGPVKTPIPVTNPDSVSHPSNAAGGGKAIDDAAWFAGALGASVRTAFEQEPGPTTVWAVRLDLPNPQADRDVALTNALAEVAKLDVQLVVLANTSLTATGGNRTAIEKLAAHVNTVSRDGGDGKERIGVAMLAKGVASLNYTPPASSTPQDIITTNMASPRMVMVAHNSSQDAAAAVAGTIAGYEPHVSLLLKPVRLSVDGPFSDAEVDNFNNNRVNWLTDPSLLPGAGLYMGEGYTLGANMPYIDIVRTVDDVSFRLKAALITSVGDLRVSRSGLRVLISQMTAVLEPLKQREVIEGYDVFIPLLVLLDKDPSTLTAAELQQISNAQNSRAVDSIVSVDYAGAIHRLNITLKFV
jgi:hypothetical protein